MIPEFDHDYELEKMYNPEREDTSRYEQAQDEYEASRDPFNNVRVRSTGRMLTEQEREKTKER